MKSRYAISLCIAAFAPSPASAVAGPEAAAGAAPPGREAPVGRGQEAALGTLSTINAGEIDAGRLALMHALDARVRDYAQRMIDEHTSNNRQLATWKSDGAALQAQAERAEGKKTLAMLQQAQGPAFDGAYLQAMVRDHQRALQTLDSSLIPAAHDPDVAGFLRVSRLHVADHLKQAQELLSQLGVKNPETAR